MKTNSFLLSKPLLGKTNLTCSVIELEKQTVVLGDGFSSPSNNLQKCPALRGWAEPSGPQ